MKILIVEDDPLKAKHLEEVLRSHLHEVKLTLARSVFSGRRLLRKEVFDLVLMDMSLDTFDAEPRASRGLPQPFGGRELIDFLDYLEIHTPVVVVTAYERFTQEGEEVGIDELAQELVSAYPANYYGIVRYDSSGEIWRAELLSLIDSLHSGEKI